MDKDSRVDTNCGPGSGTPDANPVDDDQGVVVAGAAASAAAQRSNPAPMQPAVRSAGQPKAVQQKSSIRYVRMPTGATTWLGAPMATLNKSLAARSALFWAVYGVANPRHSWAMAVVCALQPSPNQGAHTREDLFSVALCRTGCELR